MSRQQYCREPAEPEKLICQNLSYNLDQLALRRDEIAFRNILESVIAGPLDLYQRDVEECLGVDINIFGKNKQGGCNFRRSGNVNDSGEKVRGDERKKGALNDNNIEKEKFQREKTFILEKPSLKIDIPKIIPNLESQFELFSKFGDSSSSGKQITLSQSDRWLRQAQVIDGWHLTTIDTAIVFRKVSAGSIWLLFKQWREFLAYLARQKQLNIDSLIHKLETCGKPCLNHNNRQKAK